MKKTAGLILKITGIFILIIIITAFLTPVLFKNKIKRAVVNTVNESVNAKVQFGDYKLGFFKNFPNLTFSVDNVTITGIDKFENDTLAAFSSISLVCDLSSIFKKTGYEIRSVRIEEADIRALVLADGSENWNIMKESQDTSYAEVSESPMKILLRRVEALNSKISYIDISSDMAALLKGVSFSLTGDLTESETNLRILLSTDDLSFLMEGVKYLNNAKATTDINLSANLDSMKFFLKENYLLLNDLRFNFAGIVRMPADDIETDLTFSADNTSLKSLISLIPSVYMTEYQGLKATGDISLSGSAKGIYSDKGSTMPDISLNLKVRDGLISYPSLPEQIKKINLQSDLYIDGKDMDLSTFDVSNFHMELAGNPFDLRFTLKKPVSDPDFSGSVAGKLDLDALHKAIPMDSLDLSGLIDISVNMAGRMSTLEKKQYDKFKASGHMNISKMQIAMAGYPELKIEDAVLEFTPAYASLNQADLFAGTKSDFSLSGKFENYISYILKNETIKGNLLLRSKIFDLTEIMASITGDTNEQSDTAALAVIEIPKNIDFDFNALINQFTYNKIKADNLKGHIIVKDGILIIKETGMNIMGGAVTMNAVYDTREKLKPFVKADLALESMGIKDAFNTFNTVQRLAPASKGINGKVGIKLSYSSLLSKNLMPVIQTISGSGKLNSNEVTLVESAAYKKMKEVLKLSENYSNTFKDINISFKINDGRVYVSPFTTRAGNLKVNISGDQGLDQTLNYIVKTELPRSDLGSQVNSLIDNLSAQAAAFGFAFRPSETIKINVKVTGTFLKPVISPFFGDTPPESPTGIKESAQESVRQIVENKSEELKKEIKSEAKAQAEKLIEEAEEKGRLIRSEAAAAAEKIRKEADNQAQKLIKEAEAKGPVAKLAAQKGAESIKSEADKRANQVIKEADDKAIKLVEEAKAMGDKLINENQ